MNPRRAFTLIELLVVIAIIAILAALLLPVLGSAKRKAAQAACINNQKQLATGMKLYVDDNQGTFPGLASRSCGYPPEDWIYWRTNTAFYPAFTKSPVIQCVEFRPESEQQPAGTITPTPKYHFQAPLLHQGAVALIGHPPDNDAMIRKPRTTMPLPQTPSAGEISSDLSLRLIQFQMVQGPGYRCAAYCDENGQWRNAGNNEELHGNIQVLD